jgi:hypothetical protein
MMRKREFIAGLGGTRPCRWRERPGNPTGYREFCQYDRAAQGGALMKDARTHRKASRPRRLPRGEAVR